MAENDFEMLFSVPWGPGVLRRTATFFYAELWGRRIWTKMRTSMLFVDLPHCKTLTKMRARLPDLDHVWGARSQLQYANRKMC